MADIPEIEGFPQVYANLVAGIGRTNRDLALAERFAGRRRPLAFRQTYQIRTCSLRTTIYLQRTGQKVYFFFIRGPKTEDAILDLALEFSVMPSVEKKLPETAAPLNISLTLPSFLIDPPSDPERKALARALHEKNLDKVVFLKLGLFRMGITSPDDPSMAQVSWMLHDSDKAEIVYTHLAFVPDPFLILMSTVDEWAKSGFRQGTAVPIKTGSMPSHPMPRIIGAMLDGWTASVEASIRASRDPFDSLRPPLEIRDYRGQITLRLNAKGAIAEKTKDDDFRLRVSLAIETNGPSASAKLIASPPDFLTSGDLHDRLITLILVKTVLDGLFSDSGLPGQARSRFEEFLKATKATALVFRSAKDGDRDRELLAFRGSWDGAPRLTIVSATYIVKRSPAGFAVKLDVQIPVRLVYCDLSSSNPPQPRAEFPQYLLRLIAQLHNWQVSLQ